MHSHSLWGKQTCKQKPAYSVLRTLVQEMQWHHTGPIHSGLSVGADMEDFLEEMMSWSAWEGQVGKGD